jgi:dimethylhistidine N-methyltransferase
MGIRIVERIRTTPGAARARLVAGLRASPASIPPRYFYDALGCALYGAICTLAEYYPTRTEAAIFDAHRDAIVAAITPGGQWVDLGAGDGAKSERWLDAARPSRYVAVDAAREALVATLARLSARFPAIEMIGVVADFDDGLDLGDVLLPAPTTFFYPGSSIGNFAPPDATAFLRPIAAWCAARPGSGLLIGVDTHKDRARLDAAYDDALGVTALFNRNVLSHVNRLLGTAFDVRDFGHVAFYDEAAGRIEMHLEALRAVDAAIDGVPRRFAKGERIHTEHSYKYRPEAFDRLLADAGFAQRRAFLDPAGDFAVFHAG